MQPVNGHHSLSARPSQSLRRANRCDASSLSNELAVASEIQDECSDSSSAAERDCKAASLEEILREKGECGVSKKPPLKNVALYDGMMVGHMHPRCSRMGWGI